MVLRVQKYNMSKKDTQERRPPGRPRAMQGEVVSVNIRMTVDQREKLDQLGGAAWVREQIDRADVPATACPPALGKPS